MNEASSKWTKLKQGILCFENDILLMSFIDCCLFFAFDIE